MEVATSDKGRPRGNILHFEQGTINRRSWSAPRYAGRESAYGDRTLRLIVDFLVGLFALWLSLTVLGMIGLSEMHHQVLSLSLLFVASALALMICIIGSPLFVPWFAVFVAMYLLLSRNAFPWKWQLCTIVGSLFGIAALWTDALICSLLAPGPSISLNVPLLISASIPAAVLGGTICLAAAITENAPRRKNKQSFDEQRYDARSL
jgi:hypothetical protein